MVQFLMAGGVPMLFVLLFCLLTLVAAVRFAQRPAAHHLPGLRALTVASLFAVLMGVTADLAAVFSKVPAHPEWSVSPDMPLIVMTGLGESLTPAIAGFSLLSVAWLVAAAGIRRLGALEVA